MIITLLLIKYYNIQYCVLLDPFQYTQYYQQQMPIVNLYANKTLLITGTTGFLGKVLLQKFLYSLSEVKEIYVLIRKKKGMDLNERFKKQVISSACFDRIRSKYGPDFDNFIQQKIKPIEGDLQKENVGLSPKDLEMVVNTCNIIINCAASIDFNQRLDGAIQSNIRGSLRMLTLAKMVKNLDIFTHVSTCYVNCFMKGLIKEQIYESKIDPEQQFKQLSSYSVKELVANTKQILAGYPNTYTYTKALCQKLMQKRRGDLPMCIIRPAIINSSYAEPFPGWLDSIAAAAAMFMFVGLGIIKQIRGQRNNIGDTVPVDLVVNNIIVATAFNSRKNGMPIYHVGSSDRNPVTWKKSQDVVTQFWNSNPSGSRVGKSEVLFHENASLIRLNQLRRRLPIVMYSKISPYLGKQQQKNAQKMLKTMDRGLEITKIFQFFVNNEWIYQSKRVMDLYDFMNAQERKCFMVDIAEIDFHYFLILNNYGLQKYILKQNIELPSTQNYNLLRTQSQGSYFSDIKWVLNSQPNKLIKKTSIQQIRTKILSSTRVLAVIQQQALKNVDKKGTDFQIQQKIVKDLASKIVTQMTGEIKMPVIKFMAWTLHKIFRSIYEKVNINDQMLKKIKQIEQTQNMPIIFMPTHKSYMDFLIVSYILFVYQQKLPYIVSDEALLNATIIPFLIRSSGAFFYKKKDYKNSKLYHIIFNKYVQILLRDGNNLEFFIQGTRSRTGKILKPQFQILNIAFDTVLNGKINDACLIPMTINYQKVLEGDTFPSELLGQQKVQQSLIRVIKAYPLLKVNFGRVYVQICQPIFLKKYIDNLQFVQKVDLKILAQKHNAVAQLGRQIIYKMTEKLVVMSTGIVSCVLLMHRKGITQENLIKTVNSIAKYILKKGYKIGGINQNSSVIAVRNAITYLDEITTKTKKNIFELQISAGEDFQKILMLSYYRNTIVHVFLPEAFVSTAIAAFGSQLSAKQGVKMSRIHQQTMFLMDILNQEYLIPYNLKDRQTFNLCVQKMCQNSILTKKQDDKIIIHSKGDKLIGLHFSLLRSLLQSHWATIIYLLSLIKNEQGIQQLGSYDKFCDMIQWHVESMYDQKVIIHYEACSLQIIKNAIATYIRMGFLKIVESQAKKKDIRIQVLVKQSVLQSFAQKIHFFIKNSYHNSSISPLDIAKSAQGADLSKL